MLPPAEDSVYIVKEDNRSAFWAFSIIDGGRNVRYRYGRLGLDESSLSKPVVKPYKYGEHTKKVAEKIGKGYKQVTAEEYNREQSIAQMIGSQYKIQRVEFVSSVISGIFTFGNNLDPDLGVVVEIINSWGGDTYHLYLTRTSSHMLNGMKISGKGGIYTSMGDTPYSSWVAAVRKLLNETAKAVAKLITQKFGMVPRSIDLSDDGDAATHTPESDNIKQVITQSKSSIASGIGEQVLFKFACLGERSLDL
jgi:hypothetical protein